MPRHNVPKIVVPCAFECMATALAELKLNNRYEGDPALNCEDAVKNVVHRIRRSNKYPLAPPLCRHAQCFRESPKRTIWLNPNDPCEDLRCALGTLELRLKWLKAYQAEFRGGFAVHIVNDAWNTPIRDLDATRVQEIRSQLIECLETGPTTYPYLGCIELSIDDIDGPDAHYSPHGHFLMGCMSDEKVNQWRDLAINDLKCPNPVTNPIRVEPIRDVFGALAYATKNRTKLRTPGRFRPKAPKLQDQHIWDTTVSQFRRSMMVIEPSNRNTY